jgi:hypothetical protein
MAIPISTAPPTFTPLRISTMVITAHWGTPIALDTLFTSLQPHLIPMWYPAEGILKFEHKAQVMGSSHKDIFTNRKLTTKSFFNQSTIVLRRRTTPLDQPAKWKEVNVKLFANGGIQMTGISSTTFAREAIEWLLAQIKLLPQSPFEGTAAIERFSTQLINTDYAVNQHIHQDALHKTLIEEYNLFSMLEKTIYQGINTKFFFNTNADQKGVCRCARICKGQGTGEGEGQCKRITMSIFRTGRIIITGARRIEQIETAYEFLNEVIRRHADTVLYHPPTI